MLRRHHWLSRWRGADAGARLVLVGRRRSRQDLADGSVFRELAICRMSTATLLPFHAGRDSHLKGMAHKTAPLEQIAAKIAREAHVFCFDEFFVSDIADAMILGGSFKAPVPPRRGAGGDIECAPTQTLREWPAA